jgi:hypothetical protein
MVAGSTSAPASSVKCRLTWIFSPGSIVASPLFAPASTRFVTSRFSPGLKLGSSSGCVCASCTAMPLPETAWHSVQFALLACAPIVCPFAVYGWPHDTSSWHEPHAWREGWANATAPWAGAVNGPSPSGSPWHTAQFDGPLRIVSSVSWSAGERLE